MEAALSNDPQTAASQVAAMAAANVVDSYEYRMILARRRWRLRAIRDKHRAIKRHRKLLCGELIPVPKTGFMRHFASPMTFVIKKDTTRLALSQRKLLRFARFVKPEVAEGLGVLNRSRFVDAEGSVHVTLQW